MVHDAELIIKFFKMKEIHVKIFLNSLDIYFIFLIISILVVFGTHFRSSFWLYKYCVYKFCYRGFVIVTFVSQMSFKGKE